MTDTVRARGFTLIELLVVISIIALLSSIALSSLRTARGKGQMAAALRYSSQFSHALLGDSRGAWAFEENTGTVSRDLSGNNSDANFNGSPTPAWSADTPTGRGNSLSFNGSTAYLSGSIPSDTFNGDFTITAWFKRSSMSTWGAIFSNAAGINDAPIMTMRNATNQFGIMRVGITEAEGVYIDLGSDMDGKWIFGVVQRRGNTLQVFAYKDGALIRNSGALTWTLNTTTSYYIGRHYGGGLYFNGLIDAVAVYSDALPLSSLEQIYAAGLPIHTMATAK